MNGDTFNLSIPTSDNKTITINCSPGERIYFIGANGSEKTRLAVFIEKQLEDKAHRIAAHRALNLNPNIDKISEQQAKIALKYGASNIMHFHKKNMLDGKIKKLLILFQILML